MAEEEYEFIVSIPPDREWRVLEFFQSGKQVAEANVETGELHLQIYPKPGGGWWEMPADKFEEFLRRARALKPPEEQR